jgi:molecular chaperone DnaK
MRQTIDFGIDLGTTNSAVAVMTPDSGPVVVRNGRRRELTPSAVHVDGSGGLHVGDSARNRIERSPRDVAAEFKLRMGVQGSAHDFPASGRSMSPEELSAEVLKSLARDVRRELDEPLDTAVITVPAAFELDQNEATVRAARLAGIGSVTLLQEPSAAAWAYGLRARDEDGFWLVYDFGGGTFDAAVIKVEDGEFVVVNHEGDNFLGGKLVDWALVERVLVPELTRRHEGFAGVGRTDPRWAATVAKLKLAAEQAKIELSDVERHEVDLELDGDAGRVDFTCPVTRADVERALAPLYVRSLNLCRKALGDAGLAPADLDRVLLVGGTTLMPMLRDRLGDQRAGLGVPLDFSLDPVTVVARGAAVFAGSRRVERELAVPAAPGAVVVQLEFEPVGPDTDPFVAGRLHASGTRDWTGHTIEFAHEDGRPPWRSGALPVAADGAFATRLRAAEQAVSTFTVAVSTPQGAAMAVDPATVDYRHELGAVGRGTVASHSLGVSLADNEVSWLIRKGEELPARSPRTVLRTVVEINKAAGTGLLRVPIVQGERARANRNTPVGALELRPADVRHDLRRDSEVEVMLWMDGSQQITAGAYVPVLDAEFPIAIELGREATGGKGLRRLAGEVSERRRELRDEAHRLESTAALALLTRLEDERAIPDIEHLAAAAETDPDAEQSVRSRIRDTQAALDDVEDLLALPVEVEAFRGAAGTARRMVGDVDDLLIVDGATAAGEEAARRGDRTAVKNQRDVLVGVISRVLQRTGQLDAALLGQAERLLATDPDPQVHGLLQRGRAALARGADAELAVVVRELIRLRPAVGNPDYAGMDESGSTVDRERD